MSCRALSMATVPTLIATMRNHVNHLLMWAVIGVAATATITAEEPRSTQVVPMIADTSVSSVAPNQAFGTQPVTGEQLVKHIWTQLVSSLSSGRLSNVRLVQSRDLSYEYAG